MKKPTTAKEWTFLTIKCIAIAAVALLLVYITIKAFPWVMSLNEKENQEKFKEFIADKGIWGVLIMLLIQIVQVVIAVIPGEPVELVSGALYGTIGGFLICTVGMLIGSIVIFYGMRVFGAGIIKRLDESGKFEKFKFLHDTKKLEFMTFLLFFIPGTPKDMLTYFMPLTKIKPLRFFVIISIARIPSVISSTYAASSITDGNFLRGIIVFLIAGAVGILGIIFNEKLLSFVNRKKEEKKERDRIKKENDD